MVSWFDDVTGLSSKLDVGHNVGVRMLNSGFGNGALQRSSREIDAIAKTMESIE